MARKSDRGIVISAKAGIQILFREVKLSAYKAGHSVDFPVTSGPKRALDSRFHGMFLI